MPATFVVVPQWQGSGSSRAMRLIDGAEAIRGDLPSGSTRVVEVPLEAGDDQGSGVPRLSSVALVRDRLLEVLDTVTSPAIILGGDCAVELGAIGHVLSQRQDVAVVWFDAHADLNTPASSPSGAFNGMIVRTLLGEGPERLVPPVALEPGRLVYAGTRAVDPGEDEYLVAHSVPTIAAEDVSPGSLVAAVEATGATSVYLHIDLDVLDPAEFTGLTFPEPFGVTTAALLETVKALTARFPLAGAGITEFAPASPAEAVDDLPTILRLVGALAAAS